MTEAKYRIHVVCECDTVSDVRDLLDAVVAALERSPLVRSATWSVETTA